MTVYIMDGFETYGDKTTAGADVEANIDATDGNGDVTVDWFASVSGVGHGGNVSLVDDYLTEGLALEFPPFDSARQEYITYFWPDGTGRFPDKIVSTNSSSPVWGCGFRFFNADWTVSSGSPVNVFWYLMNGSTSAGANLRVQSDKTTLRFTDADSITYDAASALTAGAWHYIEIEWHQHTTGYAKVFVDGTLVIDTGTCDMSGFTFLTTHGFRIGVVNSGANQTGGSNYRFDDLYGMEIDGVEHTSLLGDSRVKLLKPNSDATPNDWTPSTGTDNFGRVDKQDWDTTEYVEADATGEDDHYGLETLGAVDTVHAIQVDAVVQAVDGTPTLHIGTDNGTADEADMGTIGTASPVQMRALFNEDPSNAAWTQSSVNSVEATQRMTE